MKINKGAIAKSLGLKCVNEEEGLYHLPIRQGNDNEDTLDKMAELENNGFTFQGIQNIIGQPALMIFKYKQVVYT